MIYLWDWRNKKEMKRHRQVVISTIVFLGMVSFVCCVVAEFKRSKEEDVKVEGRQCSIPQGPAYGLGIAALVSLSIAHVMGIAASGSRSCSSKKKIKAKLAITLPVLSWLTFGMAVFLLGAAASMNNHQSYGRGWMDGRCYVVKPGIFAASGMLVFTTVAFTLGFNFTVDKMSERDIVQDESTKQVTQDDDVFKKSTTAV